MTLLQILKYLFKIEDPSREEARLQATPIPADVLREAFNLPGDENLCDQSLQKWWRLRNLGEELTFEEALAYVRLHPLGRGTSHTCAPPRHVQEALNKWPLE